MNDYAILIGGIGILYLGLMVGAIYKMIRENRKLKENIKKKEFLDNLHGVKFMSYKKLKKYYGIGKTNGS